MWQPALSSYSLSSSTASDIKESPYPSAWADPALKNLFVSKTATSPKPTTSQPPKDNTTHAVNKGAIAGGVVGGVVGVALIVALLWLSITRNRRRKQSKAKEAQVATQPMQRIQELPAGKDNGQAELGSQTFIRAELPGDGRGALSELNSERER